MSLPGRQEHERAINAALEVSDPTAYLLADHAWLRLVIEALRPLAAQAGQLANLEADSTELKALIEMHIRLEEEVYFPAIEDFMQELGQGSTFDMYGEHDAIRIRSEELIQALDAASDVAHAYSNFARSLLIHFDNEEELVFAEAPERLSLDARRDIVQKFQALTPADPPSPAS